MSSSRVTYTITHATVTTQTYQVAIKDMSTAMPILHLHLFDTVKYPAYHTNFFAPVFVGDSISSYYFVLETSDGLQDTAGVALLVPAGQPNTSTWATLAKGDSFSCTPVKEAKSSRTLLTDVVKL